MDLRDLTLDGLRFRVALVAQDTYLFNDSLGANVRLARPDATPAQVAQALDRAALAGFVAALPDGLETHVGSAACGLSGGQRQRVAIARASPEGRPAAGAGRGHLASPRSASSRCGRHWTG